jgi:hypothetical protein
LKISDSTASRTKPDERSQTQINGFTQEVSPTALNLIRANALDATPSPEDRKNLERHFDILDLSCADGAASRLSAHAALRLF